VSTPSKWFHGGAPDLQHGDFILPPTETGMPSAADYGAASVCRRDRVYITSSEAAARLFASLHWSGRGCVYEVEPLGEQRPDPDCDTPGLSLECPRARVVRRRPLSAWERLVLREKAVTEA
jgi:hypothetical protein